jgi:hypothetical protein
MVIGMKPIIHDGCIRINNVCCPETSFVDFEAHGPGEEALSRLHRLHRGPNHER